MSEQRCISSEMYVTVSQNGNGNKRRLVIDYQFPSSSLSGVSIQRGKSCNSPEKVIKISGKWPAMQGLLHSSSLRMIFVVSLLVALKVTSFAFTQRWTNVIHNGGKLRTNTITQMVRGKGEGEGKKTQSGGGGFGKKSESPKKEVPKDFNWDDMDLNEEAPIDDESMLQEIFRTIDKLNKEQQVDLFGYEIQPMTELLLMLIFEEDLEILQNSPN